MTALIDNRSKLAALAAIVAVAGAAILYVLWSGAHRPDYAVDTVKYLKGISTSPQTIDATVPVSAPRSAIAEPTSPVLQPRAALPTDQEDPPRPAIFWSTPKPVFSLPEIQAPAEIKSLTGLDKIPNLSATVPSAAFSIPTTQSEPGGTTFRLILPGVATTGAIETPAGLPGSISGGAIGAATGLVKRRSGRPRARSPQDDRRRQQLRSDAEEDRGGVVTR